MNYCISNERYYPPKKLFNCFKKESYNFDASVMSLCKKIDSKNNLKDIYFK